jgi:2,5-dihydroxypyridine 5,6-dioxygenase
MSLESINLAKTVRMVVEVAIQVKPGQKVCIITDTNKLSIADALFGAAYAVGAETTMAIMTPRQKHNEEPSEVIIAAMKAADICIMPTTYCMPFRTPRPLRRRSRRGRSS